MSNETTKRVERIAASYAQTRQTLEAKAHRCTVDETGKCRFCLAPVTPVLKPQGRTGEIG
jgi:hypothetical protein